jgi:hypothetical protein
MKFHLFLGKLTFIGYKIMSLATRADTQDDHASLNNPFDSYFPIYAKFVFHTTTENWHALSKITEQQVSSNSENVRTKGNL